MIKKKVCKPRCTGRECYHNYNGLVPQKIKGIFLKPGCRYCTGGKRTRQFKGRDPKTYVPSWCPLQNSPPILRIYHYKNSQTALLRLLLDRDNVEHNPSEYQYAMRYEGVSKLTARELESWESSGTLEQLLGTPVTAEEIIEIDDGLTPYFFYVQNAYTVWCIPFDGEKARQNKLEDAQSRRAKRS